MSTFALAISCLTTFNLPWFMDLTFQIPMQYCYLQHWIASITSHIHNWMLFLLWLCLFILSGVFFHWPPVAYGAPTDLGGSSFSVLSFCLFIVFMGFSRQEFWSGLPFPSLVDHILSGLTTMTCPSWVALYGMAHSFIELVKAVVHVIRLFSFCACGFHSVCHLMEKG